MRRGTTGFQGTRLVEAREARGLTATSLAEMLGINRATISQYEHDTHSPPRQVLENIASKLNIPIDFFLRKSIDGTDNAVFWRSMASATKSARLRAGQRFKWLKEIVSYLMNYIDLPEQNLPSFNLPKDIFSLSMDDIEQFAINLREFWGLGEAPIADLVLLMESNGIIVSRIALDAETLDAFSQFSKNDKNAYVILGTDKESAARSRLDAGHELGHLLIHPNVEEKEINSKKKHKIIETQAFRFGSALLLPETQFTRDLWTPSLDAFISLKERYRVSVGMMIKRSHELGLIDADEARRMWINYTRRGYRKKEPLDNKIKVEKPRLLARSIELLINQKVKIKKQLLLDLPFASQDIEELSGLERGYLTGDTIRDEVLPKLKIDSENSSNVISFNRSD